MYYIWSLGISILLFSAIQYNEYQKNKIKYNPYSVTNLATFVIIFIISTISFYMMSENMYNIGDKENTATILNNYTIDPLILKKIPDKIYTGFTPRFVDDD